MRKRSSEHSVSKEQSKREPDFPLTNRGTLSKALQFSIYHFPPLRNGLLRGFNKCLGEARCYINSRYTGVLTALSRALFNPHDQHEVGISEQGFHFIDE